MKEYKVMALNPEDAGAIIRRELIYKHGTLSAAAKHLDYSSPYISRMIGGTIRIPDDVLKEVKMKRVELYVRTGKYARE